MSETAIRLVGVGKMYKIFGSHGARALDAVGLRIPRSRYSEFWALRDIDLELPKGERLGVIGRNGAGKSTLLKLITQNVEPTEGEVVIEGQVQALLEIGGGLHPEFTGRENVHAALTYYGLDEVELARIDQDIEEFTELGQFLDQPFKSYSQGMQARLSFAIATSVEPEILIVDEILGVGDAYFFAKSTARMRSLIDKGASVLLVSHALDQIVRFCDETIWLERGRIVMRGSTPEVIKAYERFIREFEDRRIRAKNQQRGMGRADGFDREGYTEQLTVRVSPSPTGRVDIAQVVLLRDGVIEERVLVGDAQDSDRSQPGFVVINPGSWSNPQRVNTEYFRSIETTAHAVFQLWLYSPESDYTVRLRYRSTSESHLEVVRGSNSTTVADTLPAATDWATADLHLNAKTSAAESLLPDGPPTGAMLSRWPGRMGFKIGKVSVQGNADADQAVMTAGEPLRIVVEAVADVDGTHPLVFAALVFQASGSVVTRHVSPPKSFTVSKGERVRGVLDLGPLLLGNGSYLLSVGLYKMLDLQDIEPSELYDYFDRSFEFSVVGNPPLHNELVRHPGEWTITSGPPAAPESSQ